MGTILLKCKLCPLVIADYEVANFYKNHYQTAHQDQIQTDQNYHQSYILANVESVAPPVQSAVSIQSAGTPLIPVTVAGSSSIPVVATEVPVELVQVQESPVVYYSDWFNTVNTVQSLPPITVQPSNSPNIQIIQSNQIQYIQFEPTILPQNDPELNPDQPPTLLQPTKQIQTDSENKSCSVRVAKKSLPGAIPPKDQLEREVEGDDDLICFICGPEYRFHSTDELHLHCNLEHEMASYIDSIEGTLNPDGEKKLIKCQFCSYRSLEKKKYLKHLMSYHSPEDIYIKCLHLHNRKSISHQPIRMKRKNVSRTNKQTNRVREINLNCSLCDYTVRGDINQSKDEMKTHLIEHHNLIRNIDLGLSHCLPSIYTPVT